MAPFGQFDPGKVMFGNPGRTGVPFLPPTPPTSSGNPWNQRHAEGGGMPAPPQQQKNTDPGAQTPFGTLGASPVRATGSGPFDPSYRQNLSTYAMGQFAPPQQGWNINPTNPGNVGMATGGGNAPVYGMPQSLLGQAQGGQPFSWAPPQQLLQGAQRPPQIGDAQFWLDQFLRNSGGQGGRRDVGQPI